MNLRNAWKKYGGTKFVGLVFNKIKNLFAVSFKFVDSMVVDKIKD